LSKIKPQITFIVTCGFYYPQSQGIIDQIEETQPVEKIELIIIEPDELSYSLKRSEKFAKVFSIKYKNYDIHSSQLEAIKRSDTNIVVLLEDHSILRNNLADELINTFNSGDYAAVGISNDPLDKGYTSIAGYVLSYGKFHSSFDSFETKDYLAPNNLAYNKKDIIGLLNKPLIASQILLQKKLLAAGKKFFFTSNTGIIHFQYVKYSRFVKTLFYSGWMYAVQNGKTNNFSFFSKVFYAFAVFGKPYIRLYQLREILKYHSKYFKLNYSFLSITLFSALAVSSLGETIGYLFGEGKTVFHFSVLETKHDRNEK